VEVVEGKIVSVGFTVGAIVLVACAVDVAVGGMGVDVFVGVLISVLVALTTGAIVLVACTVDVAIGVIGVDVFVDVVMGVLVASTLTAPP
jgi:hypothetical protein